MRHLLQFLLAFLAKRILKKYKPRIIGITGSVGKTSTKEAVTRVLAVRFHVRGSPKNYNNELGVPLTVIGRMSGGRSPFRWLAVFLKALSLIFFRQHYPEVLILEMGADHRGDIAYLTRLVRPEIGVMTGVAAVHTEFLRDIQGVLEEKRTLIAALPPSGTAVLNGDDELAMGMADKTRARVVTFGFGEKNDVQAEDFALNFAPGGAPGHSGVLVKIALGGSAMPLRIAGILGRQHIYALLAGAAVGITMGLGLGEIVKGLAVYAPPRGRMCLVPGIKNTMLIDDTYNASPRATHEALRTLNEIDIKETSRRIAVLGDMKELGAYAEEGHREVGKYAAEIGIDILITVGELARDIAYGAREAGLPEDQVFEFTDREMAGRFVQDRLHEGDVVLIKGSQSSRMENITKELMADPLHAKELLVRQEKEWRP